MTATGQSDNAIQFTFEGRSNVPDEATLRAAVETEAGAQGQEVAEPTTPDSETADVETTPAEEQVPASGAPASETPKVHKITVNGQELLVTEKDLLEGHMRHRDYTQKTQQLSAREKEIERLEAEYNQELQMVDQFLKNRQAVEAYIQQAFGAPAPQVPQIDPNKPVTAEEVAAISRYNAEQVRLHTHREMEARFQQAMHAAQETQVNIQREKISSELDKHVNGLLDQYAVLKKFEGIDEVLMADAMKGGPVTSLDEAKKRISDAASQRAAIIKALAEDEKKDAAIKAAALKKTSPEPPGGRAPSKEAGKKLTLDHKDTQKRIDAGVELVQQWMNSNQ